VKQYKIRQESVVFEHGWQRCRTLFGQGRKGIIGWCKQGKGLIRQYIEEAGRLDGPAKRAKARRVADNVGNRLARRRGSLGVGAAKGSKEKAVLQFLRYQFRQKIQNNAELESHSRVQMQDARQIISVTLTRTMQKKQSSS
jgi:hypothetical protein